MTSIATLLFPGYRRKVLGLLLLHPEQQYHVREIARLTDTNAGSLHRELSKLADAQVLIRNQSGKQVYYRANTAFFIFEELSSILRKTAGFVDVLFNALIPLAEAIDSAFVYGSMGSGKQISESDIDVLVIGDVAFSEIVSALYPAQSILGREINPKVYQKSEWKKLIATKNAFIKSVLKKPKLMIMGTEDDIG